MNKFIMSIAALGALAATVPAIAQQKAPEPGKSVVVPKDLFYRGLGPTQYLARSRLIGQNVVDKSGTKIGDIEDIILGSKDNQIDGVIVGVGGFAGIGEKKVGIQWKALKVETKDGKTTITMLAATKEIMQVVPAYDGANKSLLDKAGGILKK